MNQILCLKIEVRSILKKICLAEKHASGFQLNVNKTTARYATTLADNGHKRRYGRQKTENTKNNFDGNEQSSRYRVY